MNELSALPEWLGDLKSIRELDVGGNELSVLPEELAELKDLTKLNISMNELSALPEWLGDLKSIRELDVGGNELSVLPEELAELKDLTKLNISRNELNALPEWLEELKSLRELDVSGNKLDVFPEGLAELKGLTKFNISGNELIALPEELGELKNLRELDVSGNKLDILPEGLAELKDLTKLDISGNKLSAVPEGLGELKSLRELDVSGNKLDVLPEGLANLKNLAKLDVRGNLITSLPKFLFEMGLEIEIGEDYYIRGIIIDNNVQSPPLSVIEAGRQNVLEWFSLQRQPMHEMRVILLGLAEAGKTSLVDALTGKIFNAHQDSTQGIQITPFTYGETKINYWDFGGQEVYFSTHKFFLSEDCIYIVVIDGRKDQLPDKWLEQVKAFGDSSDTMIVANKTDQNPNIDITVSKAKYPFIKEKQWISCKTRENTGELKHHLLRMVHNHPAYKKEYPADWINIKSDIEKSNKKYLTRDEYKSICSEHNVSEASKQKELLKVLHNLGTIHHFEDIEDKQILKSSYITDAVYAIVNNSDYFDKDCGISKRDIRKILIDSNV
jgi:Leucine-rich repeat (LRR) protein